MSVLDEHAETPAPNAEPASARRRSPERAAIASDGARVVRGGGWNSNASNRRAANRNDNAPGNTNHNIGFRVASTASARIGLR
jgi:formylglycine-generating enzyme required for sulfatase activity